MARKEIEGTLGLPFPCTLQKCWGKGLGFRAKILEASVEAKGNGRQIGGVGGGGVGGGGGGRGGGGGGGGGGVQRQLWLGSPGKRL